MTDDELLASVLRKFLTARSGWIYVSTGELPNESPYVTLDTSVEVTEDEAAACARVMVEDEKNDQP